MRENLKEKMLSTVEEDNMYRQGRTKEKWENMQRFQFYTVTYGAGLMILLYVMHRIGIL
jgi:hypothetical protein